jgi:hypothetical protein
MKVSHFPVQLLKVVLKKGTISGKNVIQAASEMKILKKGFEII